MKKLKLKMNQANLIVFFLALIAFLLRFYKLDFLPSGIHVDEAGMAYDAFCMSINHTDRFLNRFPVYLINAGSGQSILYAYLTSFLFLFFDVSITTIRFMGVLSGTLVVFFGAHIAKKTLGVLPSIFCAFLLTFLPYFFMSSRIALDCNLFPCFILISIYLSILALEHKSKLYFFVSGIMFGITLYSYSLSWIILPLFLILVILYLLYHQKINFQNIIVFFLPITIFAIPLFIFIYINTFSIGTVVTPLITIPALPYFRSGNFSLSNAKDNLDLYKILLTVDQYSFNSVSPYYTLFKLSIPLVILGIFFAFVRFVRSIIKKEFDMILLPFLLLVSVTFCGMILKDPDIYRMNSIFYPFVFMITLVFYECLNRVHSNAKYIILPLLLLIYVPSIFSFYQFYFNKYERSYDIQWYFNDYIDEIMIDLEQMYPDKPIYIDDFNMSVYTIDLLTKKVHPVDFSKENDITTEKRAYGHMFYYLPDPLSINLDSIYVTLDYSGYHGWFKGQEQAFTESIFGYYHIFIPKSYYNKIPIQRNSVSSISKILTEQ